MRWAFLLGLFLLGFGTAGRADGKFFPPVALPAAVSIPDQRALIAYSNGIERLVIETRFSSAASNLAWVVPLPARPVIEEATTGLFPTLDWLFRPRIVDRPTRSYLAVLFFGAAAFLALTVRRTGRLTTSDALACAVMGLSVAASGSGAAIPALAVFAVLLITTHCLRRGEAAAAIGLLGASIVFASMLLPALGTAKAKAGGRGQQPGVSVLDRQWVGAFETTTVASPDPKALCDWLARNGFSVPTNATPVIGDYARQGWVFVAAKIRRDTALATNSVHPLSFTFPTPKAVYPLRLTGVDSGDIDVDLYVFGDRRAEAAGFEVKHCTTLGYPEFKGYWKYSGAGLDVLHPLLRTWVSPATVATKLSARLKPDDLTRDVELEWMPFKKAETVAYSHRGALDTSLNRLLPVLIALVLTGTAWRRWGPTRLRAHTVPVVAVASALALLLAVLQWSSLPKVDVRRVRHPFINTRHAGFELFYALDAFNIRQDQEIQTARKRLQDLLLSTNLPTLNRTNLLLGGRIREEDSPGNYRLVEGPAGWELRWYDDRGAEHRYDR
ncbi:MAG TPA: DUF2330 domain-containing protein [Verrucomicrobiota bacterium]|nr:DUF2330 domain-containing protein [Verrucomicrobiota bacterium]HNU52569.1 DUF2330 domain-containing protein [Verrucomicrobiota bacterium]